MQVDTKLLIVFKCCQTLFLFHVPMHFEGFLILVALLNSGQNAKKKNIFEVVEYINYILNWVPKDKVYSGVAFCYKCGNTWDRLWILSTCPWRNSEFKSSWARIMTTLCWRTSVHIVVWWAEMPWLITRTSNHSLSALIAIDSWSCA